MRLMDTPERVASIPYLRTVGAESISMGPPLPVMPPSPKLFQLCYKNPQAINLMLLLKCFYCYLKNLS